MQRRKRAIFAKKRSPEVQRESRDLGHALTGLVMAWRDLLVRARVVERGRGNPRQAA
jgi:hypothetical protein